MPNPTHLRSHVPRQNRRTRLTDFPTKYRPVSLSNKGKVTGKVASYSAFSLLGDIRWQRYTTTWL